MHSFVGMHIKVYSELFACNAKINIVQTSIEAIARAESSRVHNT
jgi:hypothetical protein